MHQMFGMHYHLSAERSNSGMEPPNKCSGGGRVMSNYPSEAAREADEFIKGLRRQISPAAAADH